MSQTPSDAADRTPQGWLLPLLVVLFVGSGCAALIYEIIWFQILQLTIGSSAISLGVLLGTFMGGMCLGSVLLPRLVSSQRHPLQIYAWLELGIGLCGLAILFGFPFLDHLYVAIATSGPAGILLRAVIATLCLLPPTLLMGATLPAVARWVKATPDGISWLGFFYGGNIAGAVCGCLLAGFFLLRVYDVSIATYVAAIINALVAIIALSIAVKSPYSAAAPAAASPPATTRSWHPAWGVYLVIALSGFSALGAEVIWTRLLSLMIGGTVYTFSIILAVFLVGLGIGSSAGAWLARGKSPRLMLGLCQGLLAAAIFWTAWQLAQSLPYWPIEPSYIDNPWHNFQLDILRCLWAILPAATLWGASFPLALAAAARSDDDPGRLVAGVYAANTVGAIIGAVAFSVLLIPRLGTQQAQQWLVGISIISALLALLPLLWTTLRRSPLSGLVATIALGAAAMAAIWLARIVPATPAELIAHGRYLPRAKGQGLIIYHGEGMTSSVAVGVDAELTRTFHVSGKVEASSMPHDMRLQRMLGHIPALVHPRPRSVLVVGCGAGVTAGSFVVHPSVERIVICEIEPLIPQVVSTYFSVENYNVVKDSRVEIVYDDARHYILTTREKFDIITSDPIHPWVKGAAALYTREYFELCKQRLNPGGVVTQWVPLYESNSAAVKSEVATFFDVFPQGTVWGNDAGGQGYDTVLLGQLGPLQLSADELIERLERRDHASVAMSLRDVGFESALDLLATYAGSAEDLSPWLAGAELNRDRNLRLQYLAGLGASRYDEAAIYRDILEHRKLPDTLFPTSQAGAAELLRKLGVPEVPP